MTHFSDPTIGVLGGLPRVVGDGLFDRPRQLEVLVNHGFYQAGMSGVECVMSVPGMFAAYRTSLLRALGGFVSGINGEDTDDSLRIGELGYHVYTDPKVQYLSVVPDTYAHLREQRMRWFRSVYHVTARNLRMLYEREWTLRGKLIMPFILVNSARRAMMIPLLIFGTIHNLSGFDPDSHLIWPSVLALLVGSATLMTIIAALVNGMPRALLGLPAYLVFQALRSCFTLESMLSIVMKQESARLLPRVELPARASAVAAAVILLIVGAAFLAFPQLAGARPIFYQQASLAYDTEIVADEDDALTQPVWHAESETGAIFRLLDENEKSLDLQTGLQLAHYPTVEQLNSWSEFGRLIYRNRVGLFEEKKRTNLRLELEGWNRFRDADFGFRRIRVIAALNGPLKPDYRWAARGSVAYLDQNDDFVEGYDHVEFELQGGLRHRREDFDYKLEGGYEHRVAEADCYTYSHPWVRAGIAHALLEDLRLDTYLEYGRYDYAGPFSKLYPLARDDDRIKAVARLTKDLSPTASIFVEVGYLNIDSNIPVRTYPGPIFQVSTEFRF